MRKKTFPSTDSVKRDNILNRTNKQTNRTTDPAGVLLRAAHVSKTLDT